ncbi:MAG: hypothetical protein AAGI92_04210 [Pseudomonadota bacterium]
MARTNKALDLARMMIKQARVLKEAGLFPESRGLARRALAMKSLGHSAKQPALAPLRIVR